MQTYPIREKWDYSHANYANICEVLNKWVNIFLNKNVDEMTTCLSERLLLVMSKNIPNKIVTCSDKDAPWINNEVKSAIRRNSRVYRKWVLRGRHSCTKDNVRKVQNDTNNQKRLFEQHWFQINKLNDSTTGSKHFGQLLKVL